MAFDPMTWSPHPMHRPGFHLVAILQTAFALGLYLDIFFDGWIATRGAVGDMVAFLFFLVGVGAFLLPRKDLGHSLRRVYVLALMVAGIILPFTLHFPLAALDKPGIWAAEGLALAAVVSWVTAERVRRRVRVTLEKDHISCFVRRYRLEHVLPLDAVRDVSAHRTFWGRAWGYGTFTAKTRKDAQKDQIHRPLVGEPPPEGALEGNGWMEGHDRFLLEAAFPYRKVRSALENRIVLAKMSPREREEQELAMRLAEDLADIDA